MTAKEGLLALETRRRLYRYIQDNPGMHLRGISRELDMPLGTVEYHLHQMERTGLINSREEGRFKAFFAAEGIDRRDKDILYYVRQEMPRRVVLHLLEHPGATHTEVSGALPVGASTVSFHLKKLVSAGIITEERVGRTKHFDVSDAERTARVLIRYRKSFLDDLVDRFARIWYTLDESAPPGPEDDDAPPEDETPSDHVVAEPITAGEELQREGEADRSVARGAAGSGGRLEARTPWWRTRSRAVARLLVG